jgi:hypothetical protein
MFIGLAIEIEKILNYRSYLYFFSLISISRFVKTFLKLPIEGYLLPLYFSLDL